MKKFFKMFTLMLLEKKAFKIGWYRILDKYGQPTEYIGYFENRDSCMTFNELKELAYPGYSWSIVVGLPYYGSDLDRYPEAPSQPSMASSMASRISSVLSWLRTAMRKMADSMRP